MRTIKPHSQLKVMKTMKKLQQEIKKVLVGKTQKDKRQILSPIEKNHQVLDMQIQVHYAGFVNHTQLK